MIAESNERLDEGIKELKKIFNENKGVKFDVIMGLSGGKDSLYLLYLLSKVLNVRTKAYTWNHYHAKRGAITSAENAVKDLGNVEWQSFSYKSDASRKVMKAYFKELKRFCLCPHFMMLRALPTALDEGIPFICIGYSPDQNSRKGAYNIPVTRENRIRILTQYIHSFREVTEYALRKSFPQDADHIVSYYFDPIMERLDRIESYKIIPSMLTLSHFIPWEYNEIERIIYEEYRWKYGGKRELHSNCIYEPIRGHLEFMLKRPFLEEEASFLVKKGNLNEEEAKIALEKMGVGEKEPPTLKHFTEHIYSTPEEYYKIIDTPMEPEAEIYLRGFIQNLFVFQGYGDNSMGEIIR